MERKVENQLEVVKSIVPEKGDKGDKGDRGLDGKDGRDGSNGRDGKDGINGQDGKDGVSVTDAKIDFDGSLVITLSTGQEINVGEVVAPELQEKIKLVTSGGAGTVLPSQTGNANKYLKTDGSNLSWATVSGGSGTVTSVGGTGTVSGISLSGTVTTSGNLTLGGTLDLSSPPAIGSTAASTGAFTTLSASSTVSGTGFSTYLASPPAIGGTTPAAGTFTTLTAQTERLNGTGQNLLLQSQDFTNATWTKSNLTAASTSATTDPLGGLTANILTPNGTTDAYCRQTLTPVLSTSYGYSVYAKAGTGSWLRIRALFINNNTTDEAWFNLSTGALGTVQASVTATITSVGNGWYRCALVGSTIATSTASFVDVAVSNADNTRANTNGQTIYVWGSQLELSTIVGTYIATTSAVVYGTPGLSFSGVAGLGLQSDGSLYVSPAGTGALQAQATTSTATGGNARGANAVDWQTTRTAATNVANGTNSTISGGNSNTASGFGSMVLGGAFNLASTTYASIAGGNGNQATGTGSTVVNGYNGTSRVIAGNTVFTGSVNPISTSLGVSQGALLVLAVATTDATATVLRSNTSAASATNQIALPNNSAYYFRGEVIAGVTGAGNTKGWYVEGVIKRGAGVGTTALVGTPTVTSLYADAGAATWSITATADTTNGALAITVTGQASTTIRWVAQIRTTEMTY